MRRATSTFVILWVARAAIAAELPEVDSAALRADVTFLASDALEGRATGGRGYDIAARYVADRMQAIGLEPGGAAGRWRQPLEVLHSSSVERGARMSVTRARATIDFEPAVDFAALPSFLSDAAAVEAPMVFVGFGVSAPQFGYDDFAGVDLAGKVAIVIDGVPKSVPAELRDYYGKEKARQIAERGAVGIVYLTTPAQATETPWERTVLVTATGSYRLLDSDVRPVDVHSGLEAGVRLAPTAAARLLDGAPKPLDRIWADAETGRAQSFALPGLVSIGTRSTHRRLSTFNVVGILRGASELEHEHLVLMAHLDHIGKGADVDGDSIYNGALDNASGIAVMLEAARILARTNPRPKRSILFLATAAEEAGLLGSRHFANDPTVPRESLVAAINLDMPVALYPAAGFTPVGGEYSTLGDAANRALRAENMLAVPSRHPERGLFTLTDQYSFVREGIPSLYLHDGPLSSDPAIDAQAIVDEFLSRHYHERSDEIDLPIHWPSLATLSRVSARLCLDVANANARPQWLAGSFFGTRFGVPRAARDQ